MSLLRGGEGWLDRHRGRVLALWLAALFAFTADTGNTLVLRQDAHGYYVYLPQLFFGAWEDPAWADVGAVYRDPETGRYRSKYTYGTALFHAPFFAFGHLGAVWSGAERNGRSMPYRLALLISGAFWMTLGCGLVYRFLRPKVGFGMALVVPTLLWAGTSLFYYSAFMPGYSHAVSFFLVAAFTGTSLHALRHPSCGAFAGNGVLLGLILAVRPTNGLVLLWPLLWGVYGWGALGDRLAWLGLSRRRLHPRRRAPGGRRALPRAQRAAGLRAGAGRGAGGHRTRAVAAGSLRAGGVRRVRGLHLAVRQLVGLVVRRRVRPPGLRGRVAHAGAAHGPEPGGPAPRSRGLAGGGLDPGGAPGGLHLPVDVPVRTALGRAGLGPRDLVGGGAGHLGRLNAFARTGEDPGPPTDRSKKNAHWQRAANGHEKQST
jgi:hypothetical protein